MKNRFISFGWSQRVGAAFGAIYVLVGAVGFAMTAGVGFAALRGKDLILFELNPLHNILHLGIGTALLTGVWSSVAASRLMNRLIGGAYLLVAGAGVLLVEADTSLFSGLSEQRHGLNILALNHPDNLLHVASALVLIGSTFVGRRRSTDAIVAAQAHDDSTGEMPAVLREDELGEVEPLPQAAPTRRGRLRAGGAVPSSGIYRCVCGQFAVAIGRERELPECPEPMGTDGDHHFTIQRKRPSPPKSRAAARPAARSSTARGRTSAKVPPRR